MTLSKKTYFQGGFELFYKKIIYKEKSAKSKFQKQN